MNKIQIVGTAYNSPSLVQITNINKYFKLGIITKDETRKFINVHLPFKHYEIASKIKPNDLIYIGGNLITYVLKDKNVQSYYVYATEVKIIDENKYKDIKNGNNGTLINSILDVEDILKE